MAGAHRDSSGKITRNRLACFVGKKGRGGCGGELGSRKRPPNQQPGQPAGGTMGSSSFLCPNGLFPVVRPREEAILLKNCSIKKGGVTPGSSRFL